MEKIDLLKSLDFGHRVAEDEAKTLSEYFVETEQWRKIRDDNIDIIYGPKGSGKSAIFSLLISENDIFKQKGITTIPAENIRGEPIFKGLTLDPVPDEWSFLILWKLYILGLIAHNLRESSSNSEEAIALISAMESSRLLPRKFDIDTLLRAVKSYLSTFFNNSNTTGRTYRLELNEETLLPQAVSVKFDYENDPNKDIKRIPVSGLLKVANEALVKCGKHIWIVLDRLDVAFVDTKDLEKNALRALFRTYNDIKAFDNIKLKIFVRDDLMDRINEDGFTEASHIIRTANIKWDRNELLHLVVKRFAKNSTVCDYFNINKNTLLSSIINQEGFIQKVFPDKIDTGKNPKTFDWILSRIQDGRKVSTPRELIHLLECITNNQIERLRRGENKGTKCPIYDRVVFKQSLLDVSKVKYENTLCAEYPEYKIYLEKLRGGKAEYNIDNLSKVWGVTASEADKLAEKLHKVGFFEKKLSKSIGITFWIPFIYRDVLNIVKGMYRDSSKSKLKVKSKASKNDPVHSSLFSYEDAIFKALEINRIRGGDYISGSEVASIINSQKLNCGQRKENTNVSRALRSAKILNADWIEYKTVGDRRLFRAKI